MKILLVKPRVVTYLSESKWSPIFCSYMFFSKMQIVPNCKEKENQQLEQLWVCF